MRTSSILIFIFLLAGCTNEEKETTTRGNLHFYIPESIAPAMIAEVNAFLSLYHQNGARITYTVCPAEDAERHFLQDTSRIVFLPHALTREQKDQARNASPDFNELIVAYDAVLAVVHKGNTTERMTTTELKNILTGRITRWEQLAHAKPRRGNLRIYCEDSSDITAYLERRLLNGGKIAAKFEHTSSDLQTLRATETDPLALGLVALDWIDSAKATVNIVSLGRTKEDADTSFAPPAEVIGTFHSPHPANLYRNYYPLKRAVYMYTRTSVDLASGFGTYVATAEGQRILLNCGLLPGTQRIKLRANQPE